MTPAPWVLVSADFHFAAGQSKAVAALAGHLARSGVPLHLVGSTCVSELAARPNVTFHRVAAFGGVDLVKYVLLTRAGVAVARRLTRQQPTTRVVVNGGNCVWGDVNWVHYLHAAWTPDLAAAPRWFRVKERLVGGWYRRCERQALQSARLVLTNSQRSAADVVAKAGVAAERVRPVYYGADPSWTPPADGERRRSRALFGLAPERPVVVFVGGFGYDRRKGFDTLLAAWQRVARSPGWEVDLVLAGSGRAAVAAAASVARAGLASSVRFLGHTEHVFELMAAADLLVSPVRYEPYGLNVQEAICRGVPALVSASAGVAEEYPPELQEMLLPDPNDADDLAARLLRWRRDLPGWQARFRPLSERLRARSWDDMAREIVALAAQAPGCDPC